MAWSTENYLRSERLWSVTNLKSGMLKYYKLDLYAVLDPIQIAVYILMPMCHVWLNSLWLLKRTSI